MREDRGDFSRIEDRLIRLKLLAKIIVLDEARHMRHTLRDARGCIVFKTFISFKKIINNK